MKKKRKIPNATLMILALSIIVGCNDGFTPRPWGYFRIDLPEKSYRSFEAECPFTFEYPAYAEVVKHKSETSIPYWYNIEFPDFGGRLYLTYHAILQEGEADSSKGPVEQYQEDARKFAMNHTVKASAIEEDVIFNEAKNVYGILYHIKGLNTASSVQFYMTDSTDHFFRGALYFDVAPRNDSLAPVIDFIREDVVKLIESFQWKSSADYASE
ncbi:MAG: gliding motility lipoprotein GldD [Flavobacteriales bacterium]|nr:gliding motility lipoprotein GldD [Flavobacteriales bacterium]